MLKAVKNASSQDWSPASWREKPALQLPHYADLAALTHVTEDLEKSAPLVSFADTQKLAQHIAAAAKGEAFILQAGDCAESFSDFRAETVRNTLSLLGEMGKDFPLRAITIGRMAGQFAKPRSDSNETRGGITLPSYKGDIVNEIAFTPDARKPDPSRMRRAYTQSAATLQLMHDHAPGVFSAHEALLLQYEQALTRRHDNGWYGASGHFLWAGDRTRQPESAHVEYLRGIDNPLGIKCGPSLAADELLRLLDILNPDNRPGRITLIARLGHGNVATLLPGLLRATRDRAIAWICDPMHENTRFAHNYKTRHLAHIVTELKYFFAIHRAEGTIPAGVQLELTSRNVTECLGRDVAETNLAERYETYCDPRLNASQSLKIAAIIADELKRGNS